MYTHHCNFYKNLQLATLTPEQHARTCNYWYVVTAASSSHTAFNNINQLHKWMIERGLNITQKLPAKGEHSYQQIEGSYRVTSHMSYDEFYALSGERIRQLSNGDYTLGIVMTDAGGIKNVHYLNPNCRDRKVFDYQESQVAA